MLIKKITVTHKAGFGCSECWMKSLKGEVRMKQLTDVMSDWMNVSVGRGVRHFHAQFCVSKLHKWEPCSSALVCRRIFLVLTVNVKWRVQVGYLLYTLWMSCWKKRCEDRFRAVKEDIEEEENMHLHGLSKRCSFHENRLMRFPPQINWQWWNNSFISGLLVLMKCRPQSLSVWTQFSPLIILF